MNWKKLGRRLLLPHAALLALLSLAAAAGLIYGFARLEETDPLRIAAYVLSFYALTACCARVPSLVAAVKRFRRENRYYLRYASDVRLRMNISLWGMCVYNAAYALFQLALGVYHHSGWFYAMAGYYGLLALMRLMLGRYVRAFVPGREQRSEWRKYRLCGAGLLLITLALSVFVIYFVRRLRTVEHHEITVIAMAAYTFGALTLAIANVLRYRRYESPVCSAAKALSLASAATSMLSLEDAMLTAFGAENPLRFRRIMLGASGAADALFILGMAVYMIARATRELNTEQE